MKATLSLEIRLLDGKKRHGAATAYPSDNVPVRLILRNVGKSSVSVLNHFEPLPVFFAFDIRRADGSRIDVPSAGKISLDRFEIVSIEPGHFVSVDTNLRKVLTQPLEPNKYSLTVEYHNQYGGGRCFTGTLKSGSITFEILGRAV